MARVVAFMIFLLSFGGLSEAEAAKRSVRPSHKQKISSHKVKKQNFVSISRAAFKKLSKKEKIQYLNSIRYFVRDAERRSRSESFAPKYYSFLLALIPQANADGEDEVSYDKGHACFYAGWESQIQEKGASLLCRNPMVSEELMVLSGYSDPDNKCKRGEIACNPMLFGEGLCTSVRAAPPAKVFPTKDCLEKSDVEKALAFIDKDDASYERFLAFEKDLEFKYCGSDEEAKLDRQSLEEDRIATCELLKTRVAGIKGKADELDQLAQLEDVVPFCSYTEGDSKIDLLVGARNDFAVAKGADGKTLWKADTTRSAGVVSMDTCLGKLDFKSKVNRRGTSCEAPTLKLTSGATEGTEGGDTQAEASTEEAGAVLKYTLTGTDGKTFAVQLNQEKTQISLDGGKTFSNIENGQARLCDQKLPLNLTFSGNDLIADLGFKSMTLPRVVAPPPVAPAPDAPAPIIAADEPAVGGDATVEN